MTFLASRPSSAPPSLCHLSASPILPQLSLQPTPQSSCLPLFQLFWLQFLFLCRQLSSFSQSLQVAQPQVTSPSPCPSSSCPCVCHSSNLNHCWPRSIFCVSCASASCLDPCSDYGSSGAPCEIFSS